MAGLVTRVDRWVELRANSVFVQNKEDPGAGERVVGALFGVGMDKDSDAVALHCPPETLPTGAGTDRRWPLLWDPSDRMWRIRCVRRRQSCGTGIGPVA